jgi:hypothetical protein
MYRTGLLTIVVRELARYKIDLVGVQEVRWEKGSIVRAGNYIFFSMKRKSSIGNRVFCTPQNSIINYI